MNDPPDADRPPEVKAKFSNRFRFEDSINTYYFWMNTQKAPFNDVKVRQCDQLRDRPRRRSTASSAADCTPPSRSSCRACWGYDEFKLYPGPDMEKAKS